MAGAPARRRHHVGALPRPLSPRRRRFALEWLRTSNAKQAAIAAGYAEKAAHVIGSKLLSSGSVKHFLAGRYAKLELEADRLLGEVARQAFEEIPNIVDCLDEHEQLRPLHELTLEQQRGIQTIEVVKKNLDPGDGKQDYVHKIKVWNIRAERTKAQELLARLLKLLTNEPAPAPQVSMFILSELPSMSPDPRLGPGLLPSAPARPLIDV